MAGAMARVAMAPAITSIFNPSGHRPQIPKSFSLEGKGRACLELVKAIDTIGGDYKVTFMSS
jgi:hypothetical protein